jgi:hypothetical protein
VIVNRIRCAATIAMLCLLIPCGALANGHGPVFGGATPTLGKGGWQLDQAWMVRLGEVSGTEEQALRTMVSFGITEDLMISASLPIMIEEPLFVPRGRLTASMSPQQEFEAIGAWRFHRKTMGSARFESTLFVGAAIPMEEFNAHGMRTAPSFNIGAATGYASRAHYFWVGGSYLHGTENQGDRMGDIASLSVVYGYRPPALQLDYPKPDLRFFVEAVVEHTEMAEHLGLDVLSSGGDAVLVGPTALLLYKAIGVEGGMLFPVYQDVGFAPKERFRAAINFSYFFWLN